MDLIMGRFADAELDRLEPQALTAFEALMDHPDPDVYAWIVGSATPPAEVDSGLIARLRAFHGLTGGAHG